MSITKAVTPKKIKEKISAFLRVASMCAVPLGLTIRFNLNVVYDIMVAR
jgi:hypothetical protein